MSPQLLSQPSTGLCPPIELPEPTPQKEQKRCGCCKKKLVLSDFSCDKCQVRFCTTHRLPEEHKCSYDFKSSGKQQLTQQLVKAVADKVTDRL